MNTKNGARREALLMVQALAGVFLYAAGYRWFIVPAGLYSGGFTGISQLIHLFLTEILGFTFPTSVDVTGIIFWCINVPLFILGYRSIGRRFFIRTVIAVCVQSALMALLPAPDQLLLEDKLLNSVIGGVLSGLGVGITLRAGGSGGGTDIVGMYFSKKNAQFSVGKIGVLINLVIYAIAALRNDLNVAAYSMLFSIVSGMMVDRVHEQNIKVSAFIVTRSQALGEAMNQSVNRGVTTWTGWGEYSHQKEYIHMVVVNKYELHQLRQVIRQTDPHAFVQILSPNMILGNFAKRLEVE